MWRLVPHDTDPSRLPATADGGIADLQSPAGVPHLAKPAFPKPVRVGRALAFAGAVGVAWAAHAQPIPYSELGGPDTLTPPAALVTSASPLHDALTAAKSGDVTRATALQAQFSDPVARKLVTWALIDGGARLDFDTVERARTELAGWPRAARRRAAAERALGDGYASPSTVTAWFGDKAPETAEGALALASAWRTLGRTPDAEALIRSWWRDRVFEADVQGRILARFGSTLTPDDHARRLSILGYGQQGPAYRGVLALAPADARALAEARQAVRAERGDASSLIAALTPAQQADSGLAYDRARSFEKRGLASQAAEMLKGATPPTPEIGALVWTERRTIMRAALTGGDAAAAYTAASDNGMSPGGEAYTEAEFFAGWIALTKLRDPARAEPHFAAVQAAGKTPVTLSRALFWRGRAAEAMGQTAAAGEWFAKGGVYTTAFYGQLSAQRAGVTQLVLAHDPEPSAMQRAAFEAREPVRAARLLAQMGERDLFRAFVLAIDDDLSDPADLAVLHDMAKLQGDQDLAMRVARAAGQKGTPLTERGWPVLTVPSVAGGAETAFSLAIARQESNFDPRARSPFARGLMQLRPSTGAGVARKLGLGFSADKLDEPTFNMTLGSSFLGSLVDVFGGSYVMAAAGYNAGPGRPAKWAGDCGDPRGGLSDPSDFIECIPFAETRNYVMRVMENVQVYRARLNGGSAPLTLAADLRRGSWTPPPGATTLAGASPPTGGPVPYSELAGPR